MSEIDISQIFNTIADVLNQCQEGIACHEKLIEKFTTIYKNYKKFDQSVFFDKLEECVKLILIQKAPHSNADICIQFVVKFVNSLTTISSNNTNESSSEENVENPFFFRFTDFLLEKSKVDYDVVRYRCCQIISLLMKDNLMIESIDKDIYDKFVEYLLKRLKDINPTVQVCLY